MMGSLIDDAFTFARYGGGWILVHAYRGGAIIAGCAAKTDILLSSLFGGELIGDCDGLSERG